jgi:hypothetical protein
MYKQKLIDMKKPQKSIAALLKPNEMNEIKGDGSITNKNRFDGCSCLYNDYSKTTNSNDVAGCSCFCINPVY